MRFVPCYLQENGSNCLNKLELERWFAQYWMTVSVFIVTKSVDLSAKHGEDYIQDSISVIETMYSLNWG